MLCGMINSNDKLYYNTCLGFIYRYKGCGSIASNSDYLIDLIVNRIFIALISIECDATD